MVEIIRLTQRAALELPDIKELLTTAFSSNMLIKDVEKAIAEISSEIDRDALGLFIAGEDSKWTGLVFAQNSKSAFNPSCVVLHFYCKGSKEARNGLVQALFDYAISGGNDRILGIDTNDKPKGFAKLFGALGTPTKSGSVFIFDMTESLL